MGDDISINVKDVAGYNDIKIIEFIGSLVATNVKDISKDIFDILRKGSVKVIGDLGKLQYINSTALSYMINYHKVANENKSVFVLANLTDDIYDLFDSTGVNTIIKIYSTIDSAINDLNKISISTSEI